MKKTLTILRRDKHFARLIKKHGPPQTSRYFPTASGIFHALLRSIIYQQISGSAARSIHTRFIELFPRKTPTPKALLRLSIQKLRSVGLSKQKVAYIRDVAKKFSDGSLRHKKFPDMTSAEIIEHLCEIKGIGEWTAHMLLLFTLKRPDILPTGDLGIKKGFQVIYGLKSLPNHKQMEQLAKPWRAHASAASWYLWRAADEVVGRNVDTHDKK